MVVLHSHGYARAGNVVCGENAVARKLADLCRGELNEFIRFSTSAEILLRAKYWATRLRRRGCGDRARGRLISKAIVCKSGGNFVTAAISVIKRTSVSLILFVAASFPTGIPLFAEKKIIFAKSVSINSARAQSATCATLFHSFWISINPFLSVYCSTYRPTLKKKRERKKMGARAS